MKAILLTLICTLTFCNVAFSNQNSKEIDSLLRVLDHTISIRQSFSEQKVQKIALIKDELDEEKSLDNRFHLNEQLIGEYQSFKCDSALYYIDQNILIANQLKHTEYLLESQLRLAFVFSMSGLFTQAKEVFSKINYEELPLNLKVLYCWSYIRYNENLIKYTDNTRFEKIYSQAYKDSRSILMDLLTTNSTMYLKEKSFQLKSDGLFEESAQIQTELFKDEIPDSHDYAMATMGLAMIHQELGNTQLQEKYLLLSAITDVRLAIKENESLLTLAIYLYKKGDVNRAYNYIHAALDDANFYNSRFRNAVIARTQPLIEATYLAKIEQQRKNMRRYALAISVFVIILIITLYFLYKQIKTVSRAKRKLNKINKQLVSVNHRLDEANLVRERYIGYYMNQCATYLDKLDDFRKYVNRKIKSGQLEELQKVSSVKNASEKDAQELYIDFDKTFLEVYPNFVTEFNALLKPDEHYILNQGHLNTELRIFALIRLGITDVNQIATFLRYSIQTIYNYKSKVKGKTLDVNSDFEEKVRRIGSISAK